MDDLTDRMFRALMTQLIRSGVVSPDDVTKAADDVAAAGDDEAAHGLRCLILKAEEQPTSEWLAQKRRRDIRERTIWAERQRANGADDGKQAE